MLLVACAVTDPAPQALPVGSNPPSEGEWLDPCLVDEPTVVVGIPDSDGDFFGLPAGSLVEAVSGSPHPKVTLATRTCHVVPPLEVDVDLWADALAVTDLGVDVGIPPDLPERTCCWTSRVELSVVHDPCADTGGCPVEARVVVTDVDGRRAEGALELTLEP